MCPFHNNYVHLEKMRPNYNLLGSYYSSSKVSVLAPSMRVFLLTSCVRELRFVLRGREDIATCP